VPQAKIRPIEFDDIQLLRYWRNLDHVRRRMVLTHSIARDEQRKWFEELNPETTKYFIYSLDSRDIGSVSLTKIDLAEKTFEGGVFCGDTNFLSNWINIWACVKIYNMAFFELKLETSYATILKNNAAALSLNKALGYSFVEDQDANIGRFILTKQAFVKNSENIQRYLRNFAQQDL